MQRCGSGPIFDAKQNPIFFYFDAQSDLVPLKKVCSLLGLMHISQGEER